VTSFFDLRLSPSQFAEQKFVLSTSSQKWTDFAEPFTEWKSQSKSKVWPKYIMRLKFSGILV